MKLTYLLTLVVLTVALLSTRVYADARSDAQAPSDGDPVVGSSDSTSRGSSGESGDPYDLDSPTNNIIIERILPVVLPVMFFENGGAFGTGDAVLIYRWALIVATAWFDAAAPYHPTAVGVYSDLGRRPAQEAETNGDISVALAYSSHKIFAWCDSAVLHNPPVHAALPQQAMPCASEVYVSAV